MSIRSAFSGIRQCSKCLRPLTLPRSFVRRGISSSSTVSDSNLDSNSRSQEQDEEPKINTWFLNEQPRSASSSSSSSSSYPSSSFEAIPKSSNPPSPFFTTTQTQPNPSDPENQNHNHNQVTPQAIPSNTPPPIQQLHSFLTSDKTDASDVVLGHTVQIFDTITLTRHLDSKGQGELIRSEISGGWYDWVILLQVKGSGSGSGSGRGTVARADGIIRRWLLQNPLHPLIPASPLEHPKTPRISPEADWSIIPLDLGPEAGIRACVNLVNEQGKERWKLDEIFNKGL
ncbi:uncharacterized protein I303_103084 [Kwoniella dejecticola CBS 10117]|uniref:Uncharacterized protein n=1 Tax=Kwoniella dejecticola CBS 10117 TaxID=1296121 RepID=A0A1A6AAJ7_9TREE|nr:uncharacterized protein I303_03104 [Kwoniella dejecticola CBS 10117]OBR87081.1 hypothetical protein I303_03104 [Kwoniella dejecticola CBS 10117]